MIKVIIALEEFDDAEEILHITNDVYPELRVNPNHVTWSGILKGNNAGFNILRDEDGSMLQLLVKNVYSKDTPDVYSFFWEMQKNVEEIGDDAQQLDDLHHFIMSQIEIRGWSDDTKKLVLEIYNDDKLTLPEVVYRVLEVLGGERI